MPRPRALTTATAMCLALLVATFAQAADDLLDAIPRQALGFVMVNRLAPTDAKLQALGRQLHVPMPSFLDKLKATPGLQKVLNAQGSAAVVIMHGEDPGSWPAVLLLLPVTDYQQLLRELNVEEGSAKIVEVRVGERPCLVGSRGGHAVVARPANRKALEKALDSPQGISAELGSLGEWLAEGQVAGVVTRCGVEFLSVKAQEGLQQARTALAALPGEKKKEMEAAIGFFDVYEKIIKALGDEIHNYAFAGRIDDGGNLHLCERMRVTADGRTAKMLREVEPSKGDLLAGLPSGPFVFAMAGGVPPSMAECMMELSGELMKAAPGLYGLSEEQVDELMEISGRSMSRIRGMSMLMGVGKPGDPIYSNILVTEKVDDSKAFLADYRKTIRAMNQFVKQTESWVLSPVKLRELDIAGVPALKLTMVFPNVPAAAGQPDYDEMMKKLFGPTGKMVAFIVPADEHTILATYTTRRLLRRSLKAVQGTAAGLAADPGVAQTAAMLPSGAQWVGYISPKGVMEYVKRVVPALKPEDKTGPGQTPSDAFSKWCAGLPEFPDTPPIGFAVKAAEDGLESQTVVPAAVLKAIGAVVERTATSPAPPGD